MAYLDALNKVTITIDGRKTECVAGSFKGVPFFFESAEYSGGGRSVQTKSIPFSDLHVNEDTGKNVDGYTFGIYILGDDAESQKDKLLKVCNESTAGELVHPHFGILQARCTSLSFSYDNRLEYISGSISFVPEDNSRATAKISSDLSGKTRQTAAALDSYAMNEFENSFDAKNKSKSIVDSAVVASQKAVDAVYSARSYIRKADAFVRKVSQIKTNAYTLLLAPGDYIARIHDLISLSADVLGISSSGVDGNKRTVYENMDLMSFALAATGYDAISQKNSKTLQTSVRMMAAASVARSAVDIDFQSSDESEEVQSDIAAAFESLIEDTDDAEAFSLLQTLEANALKFLRDEQQNLAVIVDVEIPRAQNALSLCFDVYGSLDKLDDFVDRNAFENPAFVSPDLKIKALSK